MKDSSDNDLHLGKLVDHIREERGMTEAVLAKRTNYSRNNINKFKLRKHFSTDALDKLCIALTHNFYLDKAKEIAGRLDPAGVAGEPMAAYEVANYKQTLKARTSELETATTQLALLQDLNKTKDTLISALQKQIADKQ